MVLATFWEHSKFIGVPTTKMESEDLLVGVTRTSQPTSTSTSQPTLNLMEFCKSTSSISANLGSCAQFGHAPSAKVLIHQALYVLKFANTVSSCISPKTKAVNWVVGKICPLFAAIRASPLLGRPKLQP